MTQLRMIKKSEWSCLYLFKNTKLVVLIHLSNHPFNQSLFTSCYILSSVQDTGDKKIRQINIISSLKLYINRKVDTKNKCYFLYLHAI